MKYTEELKYQNIMNNLGTFWSTQPIKNKETYNKPHRIKEIVDVRNTEYNLPSAFSWYEIKEDDIDEVVTFINQNYIEDKDAMFQLQYSTSILKWWLYGPNSEDTTFIAIKHNNKIIGTISAIGCTFKINHYTYKFGVVNFLCVHKQYRNKRMTPVLIREILRRGYLRGYYESLYSGTKLIGYPITTVKYYFRPLNIKKLIQYQFMYKKTKTLVQSIRLYKISTRTSFVPLTEQHINGAYNLFKSCIMKFRMYEILSFERFKHIMLSCNDVFAYINIQEDFVTELVSFYYLPSNIIGRSEKINAVYSLYNFSVSMSMKDLIHNAIVLANIYNFDVYKMSNMMENMEVINELKFEESDGILHFYLHNLGLNKILPSNFAYTII